MNGIDWPDASTEADWDSGVYMEGAAEPWTQQVIASLLIAMRKRRVLELGSFKGHTTAFLAKALEAIGGGSLTAVEHDVDRSFATETRLASLNLHSVQFIAHCGDSIEFLSAAEPNSYDFVWVDDSHEVAHVANELELLLQPTRPDVRIVSPGGIVLMHDVVGLHGLGAVCRRFGGLVLDFPKLGTDGGLGIVLAAGADRTIFYHPV